MRQFPVILIPPEVLRIAQAKPPSPVFNAKIPKLISSEPPQSINIQESLFLTIGLTLIVALVTLAAKELGIMLLIVGTVGIIVRIRYEFLTYKKRYTNYQNDLQNYFSELESYSREEIKYQSDLAIAHSPSRLLAFRHQQFLRLFKKIPSYEAAIALSERLSESRNSLLGLKSANKPTIESCIYNFGITLEPLLSGIFYKGMKLHIPSIDYDWAPALTYIEPELGLHIAIEVYLLAENAAVGRQNDLAERFLVDSGWIVIKFSQDQILQSSAECCKEFAKLLDRLSLDINVLPSFVDTPDLVTIRH